MGSQEESAESTNLINHPGGVGYSKITGRVSFVFTYQTLGENDVFTSYYDVVSNPIRQNSRDSSLNFGCTIKSASIRLRCTIFQKRASFLKRQMNVIVLNFT